MEGKRISSSVSVKRCGNQRQSGASHSFDRLMGSLLLSVGDARLISSAARGRDGTESDRGLGLAAHRFRGSNTPNL